MIILIHIHLSHLLKNKNQNIRNHLFLKAQRYKKMKHNTEGSQVVDLIKWFLQLVSLFIRVQRIPAGHGVEMSLVWFQEFTEPTKFTMLQLKMEKKKKIWLTNKKT